MWKWISSPLKSFGKWMAKGVMHKEGNTLRLLVHNTLEKEGPKGIDRNFDAFQSKIIKGVQGVGFIPQAWKDNIVKAIQEHGDSVQVKVKAAFVAGGIPSVDSVFATFLELVEAKIDSL